MSPRVSAYYFWGAVAVSIFVAITIAFCTKDMFIGLFKQDPAHACLAATLLFTVLILFLLFLYSGFKELHIIGKYVDNRDIEEVPMRQCIVLIMVAVFFGVLASNVANIMLFSGAYCLYTLIDLWGQRLVRADIKPDIEKRLQETLSDSERKILLSIKSYYFDHPTLERICTLMFFSFISVVMAVFSHYETGSLSRDLLIGSYVTIIFTISFGEVVIGLWRMRRDKLMKDAKR